MSQMWDRRALRSHGRLRFSCATLRRQRVTTFTRAVGPERNGALPGFLQLAVMDLPRLFNGSMAWGFLGSLSKLARPIQLCECHLHRGVICGRVC